MPRQWPLILVFCLILAGQGLLLAAGIDWYTEIVARVLAARPDHAAAGWDVIAGLVLGSPLLLLVAPYAIALSAWRSIHPVDHWIAQ